MAARTATRTGVQLPSPPASLGAVAESDDCRAGALPKADLGDHGTLRRPATTRHASRIAAVSQLMNRFVYVYILQSEANPQRFYVGCARDLKDRLRRHNTGDVVHTAKWKPWRIKTYIAFSDEGHGRQFEQYLKSASGRAFAKKRL